MAKKSCSDQDFISMFESIGPTRTAEALGIAQRNVLARRSLLQGTLKIQILAPARNTSPHLYESHYPARLPFKIKDGVILIGSDAHYWPGIVSTAHRALLRLSAELKPKALILNGDTFDGASISRHPANGWENKPSVQEELECVEERTDELRKAAKGSALFWTLGNHDMRFENRLANQAPEFRDTAGFLLKDHFPHWTFCMSLWINDDVVIKHRFKGGVHATHNNAVNSGRSIFTGHLHSLKITSFTDYNGTRYGGDSGTLADPFGPQFQYSEDNPNNQRSGFLVLTFSQGKLLMPEICHVVKEGSVEFRGKILKV